MRDAGIPARGIDLSPNSVSTCLRKGLRAEVADLFTYLDSLPDRSLPAIFCAQVVEHLPPRAPARNAPAVRGEARARRPASPSKHRIRNASPSSPAHFFLDPTHTRPVPHALLAFYLEEFGMGGIEVHQRFPAAESWPELNELPAAVRDKFFGGMDYAIFATKL